MKVTELTNIIRNRIKLDNQKIGASLWLNQFLTKHEGKPWINCFYDLPKLLREFPLNECFSVIATETRFGMYYLKLRLNSGSEIEYLLCHSLAETITLERFKELAAPNWGYAEECVKTHEELLSNPSKYRSMVGAINRLKAAAEELSSSGPYYDFPVRYEALAAAGINCSYISKLLDVNA